MLMYAAKSHIGLVRQMNQDGFAVYTKSEPWHFIIVADGMGGAAAGEVASKMAIDTTLQTVVETLNDAADPKVVLTTAVTTANAKIWEASRETEAYEGMGTTLVAAMTSAQELVIAHVGDSRAYVYQGAKLRQITDDHSLVAELVRRGQLSSDEAKHHPQRNVVTRSLGTKQFGEPDIHVLSWQPDDVCLLCSDGLSNLVDDHELETALVAASMANMNGELEGIAENLVQLALDRGAPDNITLILAVNREERAAS